MASVDFRNDSVPEHVTRFEKVPAPYHHPESSYSIDGLSRAMIAWMLDINVRASIKRREFERTRLKICLYINHMERLLYQNNIPYKPYNDKQSNLMVQNARASFATHMQAKFTDNTPIPITAPIKSTGELCRTVSDAQTMDYKLHQLEVIRFMGRTDPPSLDEFNRTTRAHRPETQPRR